MNFPERFKWPYRILASKELAVGLFIAICLFAVPGTFIEKKDIYSSPVFVTLLGLTGLNLFLCTLQRVKTLSRPVLVLHSGVFVTLLGSVISSFGFIATVNIYEGGTVDRVYRWDIRDDSLLEMNLTVKKINREFYPVPVKVGVLKDGKKSGLFVLRTGESFNLEHYRIKVDTFEVPDNNLKISVFNQGHFIGFADTSGGTGLPSDFPYEFKLVAFKTPSLKRIWVDLMLSKGAEILAEGSSEVNKPLKWEGLSFYHTRADVDQYGMPFAGIQVTRDPGRPFVFFGFAIMGFGAAAYIMRRLYGFK